MREPIVNSIAIMRDRVAAVLSAKMPTIYLYGSVVLGDFRLGWSDIDILCLVEQPISPAEAEVLVNLRQALLAEHPGIPYFRLFEGGMLSWDALRTGRREPVVYWGTSGQRITDAYQLDPFSAIVIIKYGKLLCSEDHRDRFTYPSRSDLVKAVGHHYTAIRKFATVTSAQVTSCGWLLDIARCLYTMETDDVIAKTKAGEWALERNLAPEPEILRRAVEVRKEPQRVLEDAGTLAWLASLGPHIQRFADVLEAKLAKAEIPV